MVVVFAVSCGRHDAGKVVAPWGDVEADSAAVADYDLDLIVGGGEMIMLTLNGPDTYYDYRGKGLGTQFLMAQKFADRLGVSLRVELCADTADMVSRLMAGEGDIIGCMLPKSAGGAAHAVGRLVFCGPHIDSLGVSWASTSGKPRLARAMDEWFTPKMIADARREEAGLLSVRSVSRKVFAPMLNASGGVISRYDHLFKKYSQAIRWDWRLMAAQCYQESTFDADARSWAGACGLMQIMPATAKLLGLPMESIHHPESNVAAASRYLGDLERKFADVPGRHERINFVLAAYNGGYHHIRDAMALTRKHGGNAHRWADVRHYVLQLATPEYYRDPVVKYGYMRGSETADYVDRIRSRWKSYCGIKSIRSSSAFGMQPQRAKRQKKKFSEI